MSIGQEENRWVLLISSLCLAIFHLNSSASQLNGCLERWRWRQFAEKRTGESFPISSLCLNTSTHQLSGWPDWSCWCQFAKRRKGELYQSPLYSFVSITSIHLPANHMAGCMDDYNVDWLRGGKVSPPQPSLPHPLSPWSICQPNK